MADVDMADASPPAPSKVKPVTKVVKAGGSADVGSDGKKRFEVKKVQSIAFESSIYKRCSDKPTVERSSPLGVGHRCRQLRHLSKPHHGSLYALISVMSLEELADLRSRYRMSGKSGFSDE